MNWFKQKWERVCGTRLALTLQENAQLRETNAVLEEELLAARKEIRALENTALSATGHTPLPGFEEVETKPIQRVRHLSLHQRQRFHEIKTWPKKESDHGRN